MEFSSHLKSYLNDKEIEELLSSLEKGNQHGVLLNTNKMNDETFLSLFPHVVKHPIVPHAYIYQKDEYDLGKSIYHTLGCFYLQEPSAMLPAYLLNPQKDELILDMCAAPGGKTIQTSFILNDTGLIISNDLSRSRCSAIVENEERLGLGNIVVTNNDLAKIYTKLLNTFDRIILDAPCSGSGMFRKENKMKEDWSYNKVLKFAETQKELIDIAYQMLKPDGTLVYSTCSFSKEEDEKVIESLLDKYDCEVIDLDNKLFYKRKNNPLGIHLFPSLFPGEGHYICLLKKPGNSVFRREKDIISKNFSISDLKQIYRFGDYLFGLNYPFNFKCFNVVRLGVKIGELIKDEIKYDYHYAHYTRSFNNIFDINEEQLSHYLKGLTINSNIKKGYYLIKYQGINVDISKADGKMIKNHFPKAFRH